LCEAAAAFKMRQQRVLLCQTCILHWPG
jgi:hypothetical protein